MAEGWRVVKVSDLIEAGALVINDGYRVTNKELGLTGIPFVRGGDIGDGWIDTNVSDHILPEFQDRVTAKLSRPEDVAFITKGTVGRVGYLRPETPTVVFAPQVCYWRVLDKKVLNPRFIYYLLKGREFQSNLDAVKTHGSMVADYVSVSDERQFRLTIPPIKDQEAISRLLGLLDDKIELNRRMNETLDATARAFFKSWFVDFDPVRAKAENRQPAGVDAEIAALFPSSFEESPLGMIPKGWRATKLKDVIEIYDYKRVPLSGRQRAEKKGVYPYYGAASVMDYVNDYLFDGVFVLMGEDGSVVNDDGTPVVQYVWGKFWVNNHAHVLSGKNSICTEHLMLFLVQANVQPYVTGAVQPKLNQENLRKIPFILPVVNVCRAFEASVAPLYAQFRANAEESHTLASLRDALLPKLLSGEIRVREAVREVEQVA